MDYGNSVKIQPSQVNGAPGSLGNRFALGQESNEQTFQLLQDSGKRLSWGWE